MSTPAGWYPDPTGRHQNRWFDGDDWTDAVADGPTTGVDPVRGGGPATADAGATQVVPAAALPPTTPQKAQAPPQPQQPLAPTAATPSVAPPGAAPAAGPLRDYTGPGGTPSSGGGSKVGLVVGIVVVLIAVVVGVVLLTQGGDDGGGEADGASASAPADQSDEPVDDDDDSPEDLFDDMADEATGGGDDDDVFGTDDEPTETTTVEGEYPPEVIDNFTSSCEGAGNDPAFCGCVIDEIQDTVSYDRFVEIDQELAEGGEVPQELLDAQAACI